MTSHNLYMSAEVEARELIQLFNAGKYKKVGIEEIRVFLKERGWNASQIARMEGHVTRKFVESVAL